MDIQEDVKPLPAVSVTTLFTPEVIAEINTQLAQKKTSEERNNARGLKKSMSDDEMALKEKNENGCVIC